jgi:Secretion system C-terminal sorting domain
MNQDGTQQTINGSTEETLNSVNIYPNPANSMVNLEFNSTQEGQTQIRFIDQMGRVAQTYYQTTTTGTNQMNLDIQSIPAGVYFVQMISNEQTITKRLVISH